MGSFKVPLFLALVLPLCGRIQSVLLGQPCSTSAPCTNTVDHVCEIQTSQTTGLCVVKANGASPGCSVPPTPTSNCPTNAACVAGTPNSVCNCNSGYTADTNGLCIAVIGMVCPNDAACSNALANTRCVVTQPCTMGRCECNTGYTGAAGSTCTAYSIPKSYGEACTGAGTCATTLSCTGGTCQCTNSAHTYKASLELCTDKAVFSEACTGVSDCYATINGACTNSRCTCAAGYTEAVYQCRQPQRDESCQASVPCIVSGDTNFLLPGESSSVAPTCTAGTCSCTASTSSPADRQFTGDCYKLCITNLASTETPKANGEQCSHFNQCTSKACYQCPEDAYPKCYSADCSANPTGSSAVELMASSLMMVGYVVFANIIL